jgi:5-methylcytosine-specific restriction endonuclease McrA
MKNIPARLRRLVIGRADNRCEYCLLSQSGQEATFHIDHVTPQSAGGETTIDNLALACVSCSLRKAARQNVIDPDTGAEIPIFDPRTNTWKDHFILRGVQLVGLTPTGRATIAALALNRPLILAIRQEESALGRH